MTTSSGAFLDSTDVLDVVLTPQKAPEKVVTDGYEGAIYVQCGQRWPHSFCHMTSPTLKEAARYSILQEVKLASRFAIWGFCSVAPYLVGSSWLHISIRTSGILTVPRRWPLSKREDAGGCARQWRRLCVPPCVWAVIWTGIQVGILDFKQVWSFVLSHVGLAPIIRRGTHYA